MRIVDGRVIVCCPARNFVTLKLVTEDGVYGLGDATLNGRELAVASYLTEHIVPLLIGRDARRIEDTWQYLYKGAYWRRGPVTMAAIAAVDTALWDIAGKTLNVPVYQLLGGASRDRVMVYAHANGKTLDDTVAAVAHHQQLGYKAIRAQCGIPGLEHAYGIAKGDKPYEPAEQGLPPETVWSTEAYLNFVPSVFERLRKEFGPEVHLLHDVHHRLTPIEAGRLGRALEPHHLFWMEDPVPAEAQEAFRLIRQHTTTPIAVGEVFNSIHDCQLLIQEQLIDYIRATVTHAGGLSHLRKIAALAELHHVRTGCSRRHRSEPGLHGGGAALRSERAQLRDPGAHAARGDLRSGVSPRLCLPGRLHASGRCARPRGGYRRSPGGDVPLPARVSAGRAQDRWNAAFVVSSSNPKLQIPNPNHSQIPKEPPNPNSQPFQLSTLSTVRFGFGFAIGELGFGSPVWDLAVGSGWSLGFGAWDLTRLT